MNQGMLLFGIGVHGEVFWRGCYRGYSEAFEIQAQAMLQFISIQFHASVM